MSISLGNMVKCLMLSKYFIKEKDIIFNFLLKLYIMIMLRNIYQALFKPFANPMVQLESVNLYAINLANKSLSDMRN